MPSTLLANLLRTTPLVTLDNNPSLYHTTDIALDYKFGFTLGKGSYATVVLCTSIKTKKTWACKIIDIRLLDVGEREGLQNEVDTMMKVNHDNIIRLHEVYETNKKLYMILDLCRGGELFDRIVKHDFYSELQSHEAFAQMLEAVGHCHALDIVHRDIKPENLIYQSESEKNLKLADFGLARIVGKGNQLNVACGTPSYVAPEILSDEAYGKPVDMWSLGVILYILLCGYAPFEQNNHSELFKIIKRGEYGYDPEYWNEVSDSAKDLINHLLVVDPKKRYTAQQAMEHPWMLNSKLVLEKRELPNFQGNLRTFNARRKFKGAVHTAIAANFIKGLASRIGSYPTSAGLESGDKVENGDQDGLVASQLGSDISGSSKAVGLVVSGDGAKEEMKVGI